MKIYEKPMAIIEKLNVEDVITASEIGNGTGYAANSAEAAAFGAGDSAVIAFEW